MFFQFKQFIALLFALLAFQASPAHAVDGDTQLWSTLNFNHKFNEHVTANMETQGRLYDDISRPAFFILRPSVAYRWNDWLTTTAGYAFFRVYEPGGGFNDEHRPWQQAIVRLYGGKGLPTLNWRTRLEQRFFVGVDEPTWRLRQQLRLMVPFVDRVQGVTWTEGFWRLNTNERAEKGLEQWRWFGGLNFEVNENLTLEAGYMNVYTFRDRGDTMDHVPWLITTVRF